MWLEAVLAREDLESLISELMPLTIRLGHDGEHHIQLSDARDVSLVAATGLRVTCRAGAHWPVLGIDIPVRIETLTAIMKPVVIRTEQGDTLAFTLEIEQADVTGVPSLVERSVIGTLNHELAQRQVELSWNFASTLSHMFQLPSSLQQVDQLDLQVRWGKVRVTEEAMVLAVSFRPTVIRHGENATTAN
jgi:hypothetical protein